MPQSWAAADRLGVWRARLLRAVWNHTCIRVFPGETGRWAGRQRFLLLSGWPRLWACTQVTELRGGRGVASAQVWLQEHVPLAAGPFHPSLPKAVELQSKT